MKTLVISLLLSSAAFAGTNSYIKTNYISGCNSWTYNSAPGGHGYVCSSPGMSQQVPDAWDVSMAIDALERKVQDLERRVQDLEKKNP